MLGTLARTSFFTIVKRVDGGGDATPRHLAPDGDKASQQKPTASLGRSESSSMRVYPFRSAFDLPGQDKLKKFRFRGGSFSSRTSWLFGIER